VILFCDFWLIYQLMTPVTFPYFFICFYHILYEYFYFLLIHTFRSFLKSLHTYRVILSLYIFLCSCHNLPKSLSQNMNNEKIPYFLTRTIALYVGQTLHKSVVILISYFFLFASYAQYPTTIYIVKIVTLLNTTLNLSKI
jgi:hypothetical protein